MNHPHHPGMALGPLPIGMLANGSGTPVGIGIRLPIMTASLPPMVHQAPPQSSNQLPNPNGHAQPHHMLVSVSPDSSDDLRMNSGQMSSSSSSSSMHQGHGVPHHHPNNGGMPNWGALLQQGMAGMLMNPMMGMNGGGCVGVMGAPPQNVNMGDPNMVYSMNISSASPSAPGSRPFPVPISSQQLIEMSQSHQPPSHTSVTTMSPSCNTNNSAPNPIIHHHLQSGIVNGSAPNPICSTTQQQQQPPPQQNGLILPPKEIIHCKTCTLFPPNPSAPPPTTREKPPGCRTVFVGGLPENGSEDLVREIFERCGEITTIRMSKKNFCHIRFELETYIENAIYLSGYRVRIGSNSDAANIGRLHVDYAQARDDFYEWECRQRQLLREQRHRERLEQERLLPPSPPPVVHFSDHEAVSLADKLKGDESFMKGVQVLMTWLERGDCSKKNANTFYSMIQSTNSHVRRLLTEKSQFEEELQKAKELAHQRMQGLIVQFGQIEKVFLAASHKKVWDHFTKAQRKNIDIWRKQASEIKNMQLEEALNDRNEEEMDLSESDCEDGDVPHGHGKRLRLDNEEAKTLKDENDALRCQLEAFKHEVDLIKADLRTEVEQKDQQICELHEQLMSYRHSPVVISSPTQSDTEQAKSVMQTRDSNGNESPKLSTSSASSAVYVSTSSSNNSQINNRKSNHDSKELEYNLVEKCDSTQQLLMPFASPIESNSGSPTGASTSYESSISVSCSRDLSSITNGVNTGDTIHQSNSHSPNTSSSVTNSITITEREARLLGIISTFLHVHPFGASLDYIWSYAQKIIPGIYPIQIEALMFKFSSLFRQELTGIGATLERKWIFIGFSPSPSASSNTRSNSNSNKSLVTAASSGSGTAQN